MAITVLAVVPSARASFRHGAAVWHAWHNRMLLSPAFWLWAWASWMAVFLPASMLSKAFSFLSVADAEPAMLAKTLGAFTVIAMGVAVAWQFIAWGSMPLVAEGLRWVPFWPWPQPGFTPYLLGL